MRSAIVLGLVGLTGCFGNNVLVGAVDSGADAPPADASAPARDEGPEVAPSPDVAPPPDGPVSADATCRQAGIACSVGVGGCARAGALRCVGTEAVCDVTPGTPSAEVCDAVDNDCNGVVDDELSRGCYVGPMGTAGVGACRAGTQRCVSGIWTACEGVVAPSEEACDGVDNNCDGTVDEFTRPCGDLSWLTPATRYTRAPTTQRFLDACAAAGSRTVLTGMDDGRTTDMLPFAFQAFGRSVTAVNISANGFVTFGPAFTGFNNLPLPAMGGAETVFAFWDDLLPISGVCLATLGAAPRRQYVVEWNEAGVFPAMTDVRLTFELVFTEGAYTIDAVYRSLRGTSPRAMAAEATIGIQGPDPERWADQVSHNTPVMGLEGSGFRWTPVPGAPRGICRLGAETCSAGRWGACVGSVAPAMAEVCGNALDDDCDGTVDDGC